jgi:hypothetical protein
MRKDLEKDMLKLAEHVYKLSKKHGNIYISASHTDGSSISWATYEVEGVLVDANYSGK